MFFGLLVIGVVSATAVAGEGEIEGCGDGEVDCQTCINNALRAAKAQVAKSDDADSQDKRPKSKQE